jgi:thioredoxin-related protein
MRRLLVFLILLLPFTAMASSKHDLPKAADLQRDARESARQKVPIMVFFMSDDCSYCDSVSDLYLEPMYRNGLDKGRFILRTVDTAGYTQLRGFDGENLSHDTFASKQGVSFTPVIRFYDSRGREVAPEVIGFQVPELYGGYLDASIEESISALR